MRARRRRSWGRVIVAALTALPAACGDDDGGGGSPTPRGEPPRARARDVEHYLIQYGPWDDAQINVARTYPLVICNPTTGDMTREQVSRIQRGLDPDDPADDVIVLGYVSIGEDLRTPGRTDDQLRADPRFTGNGTGPRVDPRGPDADGSALTGIDPLGAPSAGGSGYASWYLDDNNVDGRPDRNGIFAACFVNAGDPAWFDVVRRMTIDGPDGVAGLDEVLTRTHGRGLGCDGVFLDTIDTAAPNSFTDAASDNPSEFEWTAPGFRGFIARLRAVFPHSVILQNRGLFFFDPSHPHYAFHARGLVDLVLFESYRLNSSAGPDNPHPFHYPKNRFDIAPKLMAEAGRPDGFRVLSLGYAEGPPDRMSHETLFGRSTLGLASLLEDIRVTQDLAGFRHYLTDGLVTLVNTFVRDHDAGTDTNPPVWTSTFNSRRTPEGTPLEPEPRVGIQEAVAGGGSITVRWDVALDRNRVSYRLYYQTAPFDFAGDPDLQAASSVELVPRVGAGYPAGTGPSVYPFEDTVRGLDPGQTYHLLIRASDGLREETNRQVITVGP